jgi:microcystin-dependent protein
VSNPYVGEIRIFAGNFAPQGWAFCDGSLVPISENDTLFNLIGTTYGGDGQETFALPNLSSRVPVHRSAQLPQGQMGGVEEVTLTIPQMPNHNHPFFATTSLGNQPTPGNNTTAQSGTIQWYTEDNANAPLAPQALTPTGGNQPHDNMHPFLAMTYIISLYGIYPPPNN